LDIDLNIAIGLNAERAAGHAGLNAGREAGLDAALNTRLDSSLIIRNDAFEGIKMPGERLD